MRRVRHDRRGAWLRIGIRIMRRVWGDVNRSERIHLTTTGAATVMQPTQILKQRLRSTNRLTLAPIDSIPVLIVRD